MKNNLKFLLSVVCYTIMFGNCIYGMDNNNHNIQSNNNNIRNNLDIYGNVDDIVNIAKRYREKRKLLNNEKQPNIDFAYNIYHSLSQIISDKFKNYVSNTVPNDTEIQALDNNASYIKQVNNEYNKFFENFNPNYIDDLATNLLNDNLNFISEYSPRNTQVNCLFFAAWNILFQYAHDKDMNMLHQQIEGLIKKLNEHINIHLNNDFFIKEPVNNINLNNNIIQRGNIQSNNIRQLNLNKNIIPQSNIQNKNIRQQFNINLNNNIIQPPVNIQNNNIIQFNTKYNNPHVGLRNIGSTCYMNAVLQALANNKYITDNLLLYYKNKDINLNEHPLTTKYTEVINNICCNKNIKYFAPSEFHKQLGELDSQFKNFKANDSSDLLRFLIEKFHEEINNGNEYDKTNLYNNQFDKNMALQYFRNDYFKKNNSIFINQYYGVNYNVMKYCCNCTTHPILSYAFGAFNMIDFGLLDVSIDKNKNPKINSINIEDCFKYEYEKKVDRFGKTKNVDNRGQCPMCNKPCNTESKYKIYSAPKTLILILKRGKDNKDYSGKVNFDEKLDITNYVDDKSNSKYYLSGTINHCGSSGPGGHFIAYCRSGPKEQWYRYSDSYVQQTTFNNIKNEGRPFILFYTKYE